MQIKFRKNSSWGILVIPLEVFSEEILRTKIEEKYSESAESSEYKDVDIVEIHYTTDDVYVHLALGVK